MRKPRDIYLFNKVEKARVLSGRTITYIANKMGRQVGYITNILNGQLPCGEETAVKLCYALCHNAELDDYFIKIKNVSIQEYLKSKEKK